MIGSFSLCFQEVRSVLLLAVVVVCFLYLVFRRRWSFAVVVLAAGLFACTQYSQNPALPDHLSRCEGNAVVVGVSHGGIGLPTALMLAQRGCTLVIAGRSKERLDLVGVAIRKAVPKVRLLSFVVDLVNMTSVSKFVDDLNKQIDVIDVLVLNAGIMSGGSISMDGFNDVAQVNHLAQFHLTTLLVPSLVRAPNHRGRVDVESSGAMVRAPKQPIPWYLTIQMRCCF